MPSPPPALSFSPALTLSGKDSGPPGGGGGMAVGRLAKLAGTADLQAQLDALEAQFTSFREERNTTKTVLVMKSFQYTVLEVFTGGKISTDPMILLAINLWTSFEGEGSMGGFRYKLGRHTVAVMQDKMNPYIATLKKEQGEVTKELRSLKGQVDNLSPVADSKQEMKTNNTGANWNPTKPQPVHVRGQQVVSETYPSWLWYLGLCATALWLNSQFDIPGRGPEDPLLTKVVVGTPTMDLPPVEVILLQGKWNSIQKTMWEWDELHMVMKIAGSQGKLSRGKKQKRKPNLHNGAVPPTKAPTKKFVKGMVPMAKKEEKNIPPTPVSSLNVERVNRIHGEHVLDALIDHKTPGKVVTGAVWFLGSNPTQTGSGPPGEEQQNSPPGVFEATDLQASLDEATLRAKAKDHANAITDKATKKSDNAAVPEHLWNRKITKALDFTKWFHLHGKLSPNTREIKWNGLGACVKTDNCSWWNWDKETAQIGLKPMFDGPAPSNTNQQSPYLDPSIKALVKEKLSVVIEKGCIELSNIKFVEAMMFMFYVSKGETDDTLYALWFALPTVDSMLQWVVTST
eukprot:jgi/Psemu1/7032/gm1.7032_g